MRYGNLALFLVGALCFEAQANSEAQISGPYTHDNLSIFLIHQSNGRTAPVQAKGGGRASKVQYLPLQPAMEQKKVVVYDTKQVNELAIENLSAEPVFIQKGDIVKGGQQDRMISNDFVLPPKSGRLPLAAFCVEQGRWSRRGNESSTAFSGSTEGPCGWLRVCGQRRGEERGHLRFAGTVFGDVAQAAEVQRSRGAAVGR